ncbi:aminotransferase class V-fold PLP-dependent enzyme [Thalassoglobus sp.]|uniref:aminotransferase class V-fold PLP-dependent enzyme n=1 Tax=Thalassoglobus sp. TaxID=2795869 RepID=UPI003AA7DF74
MDRDFVYLNHAGTSWPKPDPVIKAVSQAMMSSPVEWPGEFQRAHEAACRFLGVRNTEQLILTPGCTSSLATALALVDIPYGSQVITSCWEHHALSGPLLRLRERNVTVRVLPPGELGLGVDLSRFEGLLSHGHTALVAITAACNVTGDLLPIYDIISIAQRFGVMVLIDAAQAIGWLDLQFDELGADFVAFGGHKALQAPLGIGGLYVSDSAHMKCGGATCELPAASGARGDESQHGKTRRPGPSYCDVGSVDLVALGGLQASFEWLRQTESQIRLATARKQTAQLRDTLAQFPCVHIHGHFCAEQRLPAIAFHAEGIKSAILAEQLSRHGVIVGSGLQCSPLSHQTLGTTQHGVVRLSVGIEQSDQDIATARKRLQIALTDLGLR